MQWVLDLLSLTQTAEHAHLMHVHHYDEYTLICQLCCCSNLQTAVCSLDIATSRSDLQLYSFQPLYMKERKTLGHQTKLDSDQHSAKD